MTFQHPNFGRVAPDRIVVFDERVRTEVGRLSPEEVDERHDRCRILAAIAIREKDWPQVLRLVAEVI